MQVSSTFRSPCDARRRYSAAIVRSGIAGGVLIAIGTLAAIVSGNIERDISQTNDFIVVFPLELAGVLIGGVVALGIVRQRQYRTPAAIAAGVYLVLVAAAIGTLLPIWLPRDNTILGSAVLAGELAGVGAALIVAATERSFAPAIAAGVVVFFLVTAGGAVYPLAQMHLPILVMLLVSAYAIIRNQPVRLLAVLIGAIATICVLVLRGPEDWASASSTVKLYSLPIVLLALGFSLVLSRLPGTGSVAPRRSH